MKKRPKSWSDLNAAADRKFREKHPLGYRMLVVLGISVLVLPAAVLMILDVVLPTHNEGFQIPACLGALIVGVGLFNLTASLIGQYLGHWLTLACFGLGGSLMGISCWFLYGTELRLDEKLLAVYFATQVFLILPPFCYMNFRFGMDFWLQGKGLRKRDLKRRKTGLKNYWWYGDLRAEIGGFYRFNKLVTVLYPAEVGAALLLGWSRWLVPLVAAGHGILNLTLVGMTLFSVIQRHRTACLPTSKGIPDTLQSDLFWMAVPLVAVWVQLRLVMDLLG